MMWSRYNERRKSFRVVTDWIHTVFFSCFLSKIRVWYLYITQLSHFHIHNEVLKKVYNQMKIYEWNNNVSMISSNVDDEDYVDQLSRVVPWHRAFTFYERTLIVVLVITFLSFVGCILLYLIQWRSRLRRQYGSRTKFSTCSYRSN